MATSKHRRQNVVDKYATIIGRNFYNQNLRDYCFRKYKDGNYYSDCSSSISYSYKEAGDSFGVLNTAGMYNSNKFTFVEVIIKNGIIQNPEILRPGDMLLFAGSDSSRPKRIGHVEMVHHKDSNGNWIISGHGSGVPSYKNMDAYCKSRYSSWASGGWRKGLVCVKRFIQDDGSENKTGWYQEDGGWKFYLGDTGDYVKNDWYKDSNGRWSWFDAAGHAISNAWYEYEGSWFWFGTDCYMYSSQWIEYKGNQYYLTSDGSMAKFAYIKSKDPNLNIYYWVNEDGIYEPQWDTPTPDFKKFILVE